MRFFSSFRIFCELSNDWFCVLNVFVVWEKFWFEGTVVMTSVFHYDIKVFL